MTTLVRLKGVGLSGRVTPTDAEIAQGTLLHLIGPNGAGKSSLLGLIAGLLMGEGQVLLDGVALADWSAVRLAQRRALLSQSQTPPFTLPLWHYLRLHQLGAACDAALLALARIFGLEGKLGCLVSSLSGGEWQRARLAAVLLQTDSGGGPEGALLLLDEPMNSLDVAQQTILDREIQARCRAGATVVISSHDLNYTLRHAGRVWLMEQGRILAEGHPDAVLTPERLAPVYGIMFRRLNVEGLNMLISSPSHE